MSLLLAIGIGLVIGAIGGFFMHDEYDSLAMNLVAGIVGSMLGLGLFFVLNFGQDTYGYINVRVILCNILGAALAVAAFDVAQKLTDKPLSD